METKKEKRFRLFGIKLKLLTSINPLVTVVLVVLISFIYFSARNIMIDYGKALVESSTTSAANRVENFTSEVIMYTNGVKESIETIEMDEDTFLSYLSTTVDLDPSYPYGVYLGDSDNNYYDPSWEPPSDYVVTERDWYNEGIENESFAFGIPYVDSQTGELIVSASSQINAPGTNGLVGSIDVNLSLLSEYMKEERILGAGATILIDRSTNMIIAHPLEEMISTVISEDSNDPLLAEISRQLANENLDTFTAELNGDTQYADIQNLGTTNWAVISYVPQSVLLDRLNTLTINVIIAALIAIVLIAIVIERTVHVIIKPLNTVSETVEKITHGDFTVHIEESDHNDEIGVMNNQFKLFVDRMREMIYNIKSTADKLEKQSGSTKEISQSLSESANLQSSSMEQLTQTVNELANATNSMAENASGLAESASETNDKGIEAKKMMQETVSASELGKENMVAINDAMKVIQEKVSALETTIIDVDTSHEEINEIVHVISGIAQQTNLLSLNASIEAARAGDSGAGFAVVAKEIGNLAESSSASANDIAEMIENLQEKMTIAIDSSKKSSKSIEESTAVINEATDTFDNIYTTVNNTDAIINTMIERAEYVDNVATNLAAVSEEQSAGTEEMLATAEELAGQSERVANESDHIGEDAITLNDISKVLHDELSKFKVIEDAEVEEFDFEKE